MNFLEICQAVHRESDEGSGPVSVENQTGELLKVVNFVNLAWVELQARRTDWLWMRKTKTFTTINGTAEYPQSVLSISAKYFFVETCRIYKTPEGKASDVFLPYVDYREWLQRYGAGVIADQSPNVFTVSPTKAIILTPAPDDEYALTFDY